MQNRVSKHFQYNLHGKIINQKNLVVEKENQLFKIKVVSEEDFVDFDFLNAISNGDNVTAAEKLDNEISACNEEAFSDTGSPSNVLAVVARDSSVAYYKIQTGFITPESGLKKIPCDLKTSKDESDESDEDLD